MDVILLGPPGAGKGTQAAALAETTGLAHVSSGDLFRDNIKRQTELGLLAKGYMDRGVLVPDEVTIRMILDRLAQPDARQGVIFDGFPRTDAQARALDEALAAQGRQINLALQLNVDSEELVRRLSGRWICRVCQTPYHSITNPPAVPGVCDRCGGELYQRDDDRPETVRTRLKVYFDQTKPLEEHYRRAGILKAIDGNQNIEQVSQELRSAIERARRDGSGQLSGNVECG